MVLFHSSTAFIWLGIDNCHSHLYFNDFFSADTEEHGTQSKLFLNTQFFSLKSNHLYCAVSEASSSEATEGGKADLYFISTKV